MSKKKKCPLCLSHYTLPSLLFTNATRQETGFCETPANTRPQYTPATTVLLEGDALPSSSERWVH